MYFDNVPKTGLILIRGETKNRSEVVRAFDPFVTSTVYLPKLFEAWHVSEDSVEEVTLALARLPGRANKRVFLLADANYGSTAIDAAVDCIIDADKGTLHFRDDVEDMLFGSAEPPTKVEKPNAPTISAPFYVVMGVPERWWKYPSLAEAEAQAKLLCEEEHTAFYVFAPLLRVRQGEVIREDLTK